MSPRYCPIPDGDTEKQPLVTGPPYTACQCQHRGRRGPSKSSLFILFLLLLLVFGYSHDSYYRRPDHVHSTLTHDDDNSFTTMQYCSNASDLVPWNGVSVYELGKNMTGLEVEQYYRKGYHVSPMTGTVVVVKNKELETTRVTFDIKVEDEQYQDDTWIDVTTSKNILSLIVKHKEDVPRTCAQVNVKIEVPSSSALEDLGLRFPNNNIDIDTGLTLKRGLDLAVVKGDVSIHDTLKATTIHLATVSGNINGVFDVDQVQFDASTASGNMDIVFNHISLESTIKASTASGNVGLKVPSDFDSQIDISVVVGNINLEATEVDKLHYHRSGGVVGHKVKGYYGGDAHTPSTIKLSSVSGNVKLDYN
ncbi:hypothetical protein BC941DRAFT_488633 [Chlamydoabsidia padenii]|nr:hypothetical protein BC941DRAFT_488633 [Chlamydoabsidia padenii]